MPRTLLALFLAAGLSAGCASTRSDAGDLEPAETLDQLEDGLRSLGHYVSKLSTSLVQGVPAPVAIYDIEQTDGRRFRVLAFDPDDLELVRNDATLRRRGLGLSGQAREGRLDDDERAAANQPLLFARGDVLLVFPYSRRLDLYYDLTELLGEPVY